MARQGVGAALAARILLSTSERKVEYLRFLPGSGVSLGVRESEGRA